MSVDVWQFNNNCLRLIMIWDDDDSDYDYDDDDSFGSWLTSHARSCMSQDISLQYSWCRQAHLPLSVSAITVWSNPVWVKTAIRWTFFGVWDRCVVEACTSPKIWGYMASIKCLIQFLLCFVLGISSANFIHRSENGSFASELILFWECVIYYTMGISITWLWSVLHISVLKWHCFTNCRILFVDNRYIGSILCSHDWMSSSKLYYFGNEIERVISK